MSWGWSLAADEHATSHWSLRARGVGHEAEEGDRFCGRASALLAIADWLDRPKPDPKILLVRASPGGGKSATLARIVVSADPDFSPRLAGPEGHITATPGSVSCAVHAQGMSVAKVIEKLALAAGIAVPRSPEEFVVRLRNRLEETGLRFNVIVDALDEAESSHQAHAIIHSVILPMVQMCAHLGAQAVVGSRTRIGETDLATELGEMCHLIDLDSPEFFAEADLEAFALATLQGPEGSRPDNPYREVSVALPVASRIAELATRNFLVARLIAAQYALYHAKPIDPAQVAFTSDVNREFAKFVQTVEQGDWDKAGQALTALAFAESDGFPLTLWTLACNAQGLHTSEDQLARFAASAAGNFLVQTGTETGGRYYRLEHSAFSASLLKTRAEHIERIHDERRLTTAFIEHGLTAGWPGTHPYLLEHLPAHAQRAGMADRLLDDEQYLLHANLRSLLLVADDCMDPQQKARARLLRLSAPAGQKGVGASERLAMFSVTQMLHRLDTGLNCQSAHPYRASWAYALPQPERAVLEAGTEAVAVVRGLWSGTQQLIVTAGESGMALWDSVTGRQERVMPYGGIPEMTALALDMAGESLLACTVPDGSIHIVDVATGAVVKTMRGHANPVRAACSVWHGPNHLLATGSDDGSIRIWDIATGQCVNVLSGHDSWVTALCTVGAGETAVLASASQAGSVRSWDIDTGQEVIQFSEGDGNWVTGLCAIKSEKESLLAAAAYDGHIRLWDITTGALRADLDTASGPLTAICSLRLDHREYVATSGDDGAIQIWDPENHRCAQVLQGHKDRVNALHPFTVGASQILVSGSDDGTARLWDATLGPEPADDHDEFGPITALSVAQLDSQSLLVAALPGQLRMWDLANGRAAGHIDTVGRPTALGRWADCVVVASADGEQHTIQILDLESGRGGLRFTGHADPVRCLASTRVGGVPVMASAGDDQTVLLWDPYTGEQLAALNGHGGPVNSICGFKLGERVVLASASSDQTVRLWDPSDRSILAVLTGHEGAVNTVLSVEIGGSTMLVSSGADHTIRIWNAQTTAQFGRVLSGHTGPVTSTCTWRSESTDLLASTSTDKTARIWDMRRRLCLATIPVHHPALTCAYHDGQLLIGLEAGLLTVSLTGFAGAALSPMRLPD